MQRESRVYLVESAPYTMRRYRHINRAVISISTAPL